MTEERVNITWDEFQQVRALRESTNPFEPEWEAGLRRVLGDFLVDGMKARQAQKPTLFLLRATEPVPRELPIAIEAEESQ